MNLTKQSESTHETFVAENKDYKYLFEVVKENGKVKSVTCGVTKKLEGREQHAGYLSLNNGTKGTSFPESEGVAPHIEVFEDFLKSLKDEDSKQ